MEWIYLLYLAFGIFVFMFVQRKWRKRNRTIQAIKCGHSTKMRGRVVGFDGDSFLAELPVVDDTTTYCHDCLGKMTIRCAWCSRSIFVGKPITLSVQPLAAQMPAYARYLNLDEGRAYIGCAACAKPEDNRTGFWTQPGTAILNPPSFAIYKQSLSADGKTEIIVLGRRRSKS